MNLKQLAATLLAGLIVSAGAAGAVAAAPGNGAAPDDVGPNDEANGTATDAAEEDPMNASEDESDEQAADATDEEPAPAADEDRRGPPSDMPEQVPDHVEEIHSLINDHLDGAISDLGSAISDVTPGDESDDESAGEEQADANASTTPTDVPA